MRRSGSGLSPSRQAEARRWAGLNGTQPALHICHLLVAIFARPVFAEVSRRKNLIIPQTALKLPKAEILHE